MVRPIACASPLRPRRSIRRTAPRCAGPARARGRPALRPLLATATPAPTSHKSRSGVAWLFRVAADGWQVGAGAGRGRRLSNGRMRQRANPLDRGNDAIAGLEKPLLAAHGDAG